MSGGFLLGTGEGFAAAGADAGVSTGAGASTGALRLARRRASSPSPSARGRNIHAPPSTPTAMAATSIVRPARGTSGPNLGACIVPIGDNDAGVVARPPGIPSADGGAAGFDTAADGAG